jgi:hypothetical protein
MKKFELQNLNFFETKLKIELHKFDINPLLRN